MTDHVICPGCAAVLNSTVCPKCTREYDDRIADKFTRIGMIRQRMESRNEPRYEVNMFVAKAMTMRGRDLQGYLDMMDRNFPGDGELFDL